MRFKLDCYVMWRVVLSLSLVATACGDGNISEVAESDISHVPIQESRITKSLGSESSRDSSDGLYDSVQIESSVSEDKGALALSDRTQGKTVRLLVDSITLNDCVMRGEIHNYSKDQYARNVTVTIAARDGDGSVKWHWPLTIEPGESAPFEVDIDWPPHTYSYSDPDGYIHDSLDINYWNWFGNTYVDVETDLSPAPDLRRAFEFNSDGTEFDALWQNPAHKFLVYDERALELEESKNWYRYGQEYSVISKPQFVFSFPGDVVKSNDIESFVSQFSLYKYVDVFYVPSRIYPDIYEANEADIVSDVRVYQAFKDGPKVIDVRELIPHSVIEEVSNNGLLVNRKLNPVSDFVNFDVSNGERIYLQLLDPYHFPEDFPTRNFAGEASTNRGDNIYRVRDDLWIGGVSHSGISSIGDSSLIPTSSNSNSCYVPGALCVGNFTLRRSMLTQIIRALGRKGVCPSSETETKQVETISVDHESVTLRDQSIRGLIYNSSEKNFAREVIVTASHKNLGIKLGIWRWPLAVQPGEYAPFEIPYHVSNLNVEEIQFEVFANLSEAVDPTRAFLIEPYVSGEVYGTEFWHLYEDIPFASPFPRYHRIRPGDILDYNAIISTPRIRYTKESFLELYEGAVLPEDVEGLELFGFQDLYARLEPPDSHPELAKIATTQFIHDLRGYTAIFDRNDRIVDVKKVSLFTPVYGQANISKPYVEVSSIPAPNRWSPNAVRIMRIIPYEDEDEMIKGYYSQVWIGGAAERTE